MRRVLPGPTQALPPEPFCMGGGPSVQAGKVTPALCPAPPAGVGGGTSSKISRMPVSGPRPGFEGPPPLPPRPPLYQTAPSHWPGRRCVERQQELCSSTGLDLLSPKSQSASLALPHPLAPAWHQVSCVTEKHTSLSGLERSRQAASLVTQVSELSFSILPLIGPTAHLETPLQTCPAPGPQGLSPAWVGQGAGSTATTQR